MNDKVTKMSIAERIAGEVRADETIEKKRPEFLKRFKAETSSTDACARSYFQMLKYELEGGKKYKHHNKKKAKADPVAAAPVQEVGDATVATADATGVDEAAA